MKRDGAADDPGDPLEAATIAPTGSGSLPDLIGVPERPRTLLVRGALVAGALLCLVLGVIGWLIPVVSGVPFYILGLVLLGLASPATARWINRQERRLPLRWRLRLRRRRKQAPGGGA